jgi:hypothetical protein
MVPVVIVAGVIGCTNMTRSSRNGKRCGDCAAAGRHCCYFRRQRMDRRGIGAVAGVVGNIKGSKQQ